MTGETTIRLATEADVACFCRHRFDMFMDMGSWSEKICRRTAEVFAPWALKHMADDTFLTWLACEGEKVVGGAGLWITESLPHPVNPKGLRGYLLNVYVEPEWRRKGLATALVQKTIDYCHENEIMLMALHASDSGLPVYQKMGWELSQEMRLFLGPEGAYQEL